MIFPKFLQKEMSDQKSMSMKQKRELLRLTSEEDELQNTVWMKSVKVTLGLVGKESSIASIYSVPNQLRNSNNDAFSPRLVSIGPIHRLKDGLLPMQAHKWVYMLDLLQRTPKPEECLDSCSKFLLQIDMMVRASYAGRVDNLKAHELADIMLVDGCFLLQLFLRFDEHSSSSSSSAPKPADQDDDWDPLFKNDGASSRSILPLIRHDLTLFENQIPLFVLEHLFDLIKSSLKEKKNPSSPSLCKHEQPNDKATSSTSSEKGPEFKSADNDGLQHQQNNNNNEEPNWHKKSVMELAHSFFSSPYFCSNPDKFDEKYSHFKNFLDVFHKSYYIPKEGKRVGCTNTTKLGYCAREIEQAGINIIKMKKEAGKKLNLLQISFCKGRKELRIPPLKIQQTTESFIRNLIALEQCGELGNSCNYFTSYAFFLRDLICSSSDLKLLMDKGIIKSNNPDDQNDISSLLDLFQGLTQGVDSLEESWFGTLCEDLNESIKPWWCFWRWHRCLESWKVRLWKYHLILLREYCPNPWRITQIFAAFLILLFTGLQTFYTVSSS
ncbi:UPF0481 protein At3g47200-like [Ziziphus jujuba]|uniref:UPF0481 protein At3g47200-like n=1 Tax=Ziziphus jujuba TaxID=326968 RepID=A0ABM4ACR1_ZIZJJ|nr:UPF0481 protein At3g47200-like [Ziziphus jujuba]